MHKTSREITIYTEFFKKDPEMNKSDKLKILTIPFLLTFDRHC